ncbi:hypothetical protein ACFLTZ_02300 [Chloroflexota bacterium]
MRKIYFPIEELALYHFFNNIYMLGISAGSATDHEKWEGRPLWRVLTDACYDPATSATTLEDALIFNKLGRIVYQTFSRQQEEHKIADKVRWLRTKPGELEQELADFEQEKHELALTENSFYPPISPVIMEILNHFIPGAKNMKLETLLDDRMFVHTCLGFAGDKPEYKVGEECYHAAFSLAIYVDCFSDADDSQGGYAYDQRFIKKLLRPQTYTVKRYLSFWSTIDWALTANSVLPDRLNGKHPIRTMLFYAR